MGPKLDLKSVTICAADCVNADLAIRALNLSMRVCAFGDAILFSDRDKPGPIRVELIEPLRSSDQYSRFILRDLHRYATTPFVLIVQWDGYVVDTGSWTSQFLDYDYVGAVWPWAGDRKVGNGGFSLRSRRLLEATAAMADDRPIGTPEDVAICMNWAARLEKTYGIRFAPEALASRFSYELLLPDVPTFGFHGMFNMWRHLSNDEIVSLAAALDPSSLWGVGYMQCMLTCFFQRRFAPLAALYARLRAHRSIEEVGNLVKNVEPNTAFVADFLAIAEATLRTSSLDRLPSGFATGR